MLGFRSWMSNAYVDTKLNVAAKQCCILVIDITHYFKNIFYDIIPIQHYSISIYVWVIYMKAFSTQKHITFVHKEKVAITFT